MEKMTNGKSRLNVGNDRKEACSRIVDLMKSGVYAADNEGNINFANQALAEIFQYNDMNEMVGINLPDGLYEDPNDRKTFLKVLKEKGQVCDYQIKMIRKDGSRIIVSVRSNVLSDQDGEVVGVEGVLNEIQNQEPLDDFERFITDPLTKLYNYQYFSKQLEMEIQRVNEYFSPLCMMMVDIDTFHLYNDEFGKDGGDELLKEIAQIFKANFKKADVLCRQSQDQFLIMLPNTKRDDALALAKKVKDIVQQGQFKKSITCSMGLSRYIPGMTQQELFLKANMGLYMAKEVGKNEACLYG